MPHRLREARKLDGFVASMPVRRRAELWFEEAPSARPTESGSPPAGPDDGPEIGLPGGIDEPPTEFGGLPAGLDRELAEPDRARAIARWLAPERADDDQADDNWAADEEPDGPAPLAEPDAAVTPVLEAADNLAADEEEDGLDEDVSRNAMENLSRELMQDIARTLMRDLSRTQMSEPATDDVPPVADRAVESPVLVGLREHVDAERRRAADDTAPGNGHDHDGASDPAEIPDREIEAAGEPAAPAPAEAEEEAADPVGADEPAAAEAAPLPDWREAGRRGGDAAQGEDFLAAIRSVLDDATRYDSQMSAALIDLHLDLVICANRQRQAVAEAAEEVRLASIGLFTALYRDGGAEAERVMAKVATDRLEASLWP